LHLATEAIKTDDKCFGGHERKIIDWMI
jgi:hypothetical protein